MPAVKRGGPDHVVIVGSGFAGIGMGYRLLEAGIRDFTILERAERVGGTWRDNHYPGAACDIESHLYSFSFAPNPDWTRTYAPQREILDYLERCVTDFGLRPHLRLGCGATSARLDEQRGTWTVGTSDGDEIEARVVVSAAGHALSTPIYPDIAGRETFAGPQFHSARWPTGGAADLTGKRVAVIGTGASAIQIVPSIAPLASKLSVFQRTPPWIIPRNDRAIPATTRAAFRRLPSLQRLARESLYWRHETYAFGFVREPRIMRMVGKLAIRFLAQQVKHPALREQLTPQYTMGCKRVLLSDDYYSTLTRENVELVTEPIASIRPRGIVTSDGTADGRAHDVDVIVHATGFEAAEARPHFSMHGRGGVALEDTWRDGAQAYLGTAVAGFPNLFLLLGPNTGLGHSSMIYMIESQLAYVLGAIRTMRDRRLKLVQVKDAVVARYNGNLQRHLARTVWQTGGCSSWYRTRDGRNTTLWPGFTYDFRRRTARFDAESYELVSDDSAAPGAPAGASPAATRAV